MPALFGALFLMTFSIFFSSFLSAKVYMTNEQFFEQVSKQNPSAKFKTKTIWLKKTIQSKITNILDHKYPKLRLRYKISKNNDSPTSIWYLDEIGKERPITFGVSVKDDRIQAIRVLEFRESRGYEINIPSFASQFENIGVDEKKNLDKNIDGITGATMSVSAMKKVARLAILLHHSVKEIP